MKNLIKYGFIAVVICFCSCGHKDSQEVKVGQIWRYSIHGSKNPFDSTTYTDQEIMDIKNGYVQYKENGKLYSYRIGLVKVNAECINCR